MHNMTDDDLYRIGTELHEDPTWDGGWMRGGRPVTCYEMMASMAARRAERGITKIEQGCCGLEPLFNGRCPDGGICPRQEARVYASEFFRRLAFLVGINE